MYWKVQTVKCEDRQAWVREIIDAKGDLVAELAFETNEKPKANQYESLILAAPELLEELEGCLAYAIAYANNFEDKDTYEYIKQVQTLIKRAKGN